MQKLHYLFLIIFTISLTSGCTDKDTQSDRHTAHGTDSISNPIVLHRLRTDSLESEKSLYRKYCIASDNAAFFEKEHMPYDLGRNLEILGNVMAQLDDSTRALYYYDRAVESFREAGAMREIYENRLHRTNTMPHEEGMEVFRALLADSTVLADPRLHMQALKGAYLCSDSLPLLDSCLALADKSPSAAAGEHSTLLALRARESLIAGDIADALARIPHIKEVTAEERPIAQHREFIHVAIAQIYNAAGEKDSCIDQLCKVVWWTDSAYREANLPAIYSQETRRLIDLSEHTAKMEKRSMAIWWILSAIIFLSLATWLYIQAKRRQTRARHEIEMLDQRLEYLQRSQTAMQAVMEENKRLIADIEEVLPQGPTASDPALAISIRRILNLYTGREENRQGFLAMSREIDPRFSAKLKADFPALSEGQLRLAALIAAGVDSHQLATILNISSRSLYTSRYRLRTTLGLEKNDSLEELLRRYS